MVTLRGKKMKKFSIKLQLFIFLSLFLVFLAIREGNLVLFIKGIVALMSSVATDSLLYWIKNKKLKITESSLVTGLIIGFVLSSDMEWWTFALAGVLSILSAYIIRLKGRHVFNPAALGIFLVLVLFNGSTQWLGAYTWHIIIPFGLYFVFRIKKLAIALGYYFAYLLLYGIQSYTGGASLFDLLLYANYFFIFIMLIEPKTTPFDRRGKILFGIAVGTISFVLYSLRFPHSAELPSLLMANLIFGLLSQKMKGGKK